MKWNKFYASAAGIFAVAVLTFVAVDAWNEQDAENNTRQLEILESSGSSSASSDKSLSTPSDESSPSSVVSENSSYSSSSVTPSIPSSQPRSSANSSSVTKPEVPSVTKPEIPNVTRPEIPNMTSSRPSQQTSSKTEPSTPGGDISSYAEQVVQLVNQERAKAGLSALSINQSVKAAAQVRAKEIEGTFSHTRPNGSNFSTALSEQGVRPSAWGENIAWGQRTPEEVMRAWMNSPGHKANILGANFTSIGVGCYRNSSGTYYWTQLFIG